MSDEKQRHTPGPGEMQEPQIKLMSSGYWHVRWGANYWAQWRKGDEPTEADVFAPSWNWQRFQAWWERSGRAAIASATQ